MCDGEEEGEGGGGGGVVGEQMKMWEHIKKN